MVIGDDELDLIRKGELVLQPGQWFRLAWGGDNPSRWVGLTKAGSVWAAHYGKGSHAQFLSMCKSIDRWRAR